MRKLRWIGIGILVLAIGVSVPELVFKATGGLSSVVPGECYRASEMSPEKLVRVCRKLGVKIVVDLRSPLDGLDDKPPGWSDRKVAAEFAALERAGIQHINVPARQIANKAMTDMFVQALSKDGTRPVLIHCDHGIGRTGFFVAIYLVEFEGYSREDARRHVARFYSIRPRGRRHFWPDFNKGKVILEYVPRRGGTPG